MIWVYVMENKEQKEKLKELILKVVNDTIVQMK